VYNKTTIKKKAFEKKKGHTRLELQQTVIIAVSINVLKTHKKKKDHKGNPERSRKKKDAMKQDGIRTR
jgi:hypothetical protein